MRKIKNTLSLFLAMMLLAGCNESLEDTYKSVTDGGKIRYVAKCSDIRVNSGWERLIIEWKNGTDATIHKIKLTWTYDGKKDSVLLEPLTTKFELNKLYNTVYRFDIVALDKEGNKSLNETTYGRPYTKDHEIMNAFSRGVAKAYFLKNKMIFFADKYNENILEMILEYKDTKGETQQYVFTKNTYGDFITINDVSMNPDDEVYILRRGKFEDSVDEIVFDPYPISRMKNYSSGFLHAIERRYGYSTNTKEEEILFEKFINEVEELEFDYDIETFEDILYCPNLKKLIFGKNRYLSNKYEPKYRSMISSDETKSKLVVDKARDLLGLEIDYYGADGSNDEFVAHYFKFPMYFSKYMGFSTLPIDMEIIGKEAFREYENGDLISSTPKDPYAKVNNLLDNDNISRWETTSSTQVKRYTLQMELKEVTMIRGIKIAQPYYYPDQDLRTPFFMLKTIDIETSVDGAYWENVTYFKSVTLGRSSGEVTLLKFPEGERAVRQVRVTVQDGIDLNGNCMISLGDIVLYK